jgi:NurA domain
MTNFIAPLEAAALRKKPHLASLFSANQSAEENALFRLFCDGHHWHPLPKRANPIEKAMAVDGGLRTFDLSNGGTLVVAQSLLIGNGIEDSAADVEILRGTVSAQTVDRFTDLFRQKLEVFLAAKHIRDLGHNGVMYLDGALYGGLPYLYPMPERSGVPEDPTIGLVEDYGSLFAACDEGCILISIAKSSRDSMLVDVLQEEAGIPKEGRAAMPDSEVIYRWTDQKGGFSTPVILGSHSFLGGAAAILLEPSHPVARMPAMLSFFVRLTDYAPALRVDVPGVCVGRQERIIDLGAALADWRGVEPVIAALGSDYCGARVYNPLLYAADQEVAIHRDRFQNLYLPLLRNAWGVSLDPTLSFARFM